MLKKSQNCLCESESHICFPAPEQWNYSRGKQTRGKKKKEKKKGKKEKEGQEMRISTWPGIWGNYIFKVEQANVFKVDSICKLDLFLFLHIDVCVQSPVNQLSRQGSRIQLSFCSLSPHTHCRRRSCSF